MITTSICNPAPDIIWNIKAEKGEKIVVKKFSREYSDVPEEDFYKLFNFLQNESDTTEYMKEHPDDIADIIFGRHSVYSIDSIDVRNDGTIILWVADSCHNTKHRVALNRSERPDLVVETIENGKVTITSEIQGQLVMGRSFTVILDSRGGKAFRMTHNLWVNDKPYVNYEYYD